MGLSVRDRGNLRHRRRNAGASLLDMTPLIDVVFQLLIFFLLTATFQQDSSIDVDLARAKNQKKSEKQEAVLVSISARGEFEVDKVLIESIELENLLCSAAKQGRTTLHVRADKSSKNEDLVKAMDAAKTCGFDKLGILHAN